MSTDKISVVNSEPSFVHDDNRGKWTNKTEFILSCIGYAIGTGNVWRFPYLCYRSGGGAFLIPYLIMLFACGIPLFYMEIIIGQFSSTGCLAMFRMCPILKGTGYAMIAVNFLCVCYYSVIISYPIRFVTKIFSKELPWINCNNEWNTEDCVDMHDVGLTNISSSYKTPADEFFHNEVLHISSGIEEVGTIVWPLFYCLIFSWLSIFVCIMKGVKSVGKAVYFTALFPFFILIVIFVRGVTLPGASLGISFYLKPDWAKVLDLRIWADAALQIFFSLGPGWGGIVNMASYNNFHNKPKIDSILVPILNSATSIYAGFVVFSVLGFMAEKTGLPVSKVVTGGAGLAFVTYPQAIAMLPWSHMWAGLFFTMLFFMGLDSIFVQLEAIISSVCDEVPVLRPHKFFVTAFMCVLMFFISAIMTTNGGMYIVQLFDWYAAAVAVIFICLIETIMVCYIYGSKKFSNDIYFMLGKRPNKWVIMCLKYFTTGILIFILFAAIFYNRRAIYNSVPYPDWAIAFGWSTCVLSVISIPIYMLYFICKRKGSSLLNLKIYSQPYDWTPASEKHREEYLRFLSAKDDKKFEFISKQ